MTRAAALVLLLACGGPPAPPPELTCENDARVTPYSAGMRTEPTTSGVKVELTKATPEPLARGTNTMNVRVLDGSSAPLSDATLSLVPFMPDHGHGSSVTPQVTAHGDGTFTIESLYLFMPGVWQLTFTVKSAGTTSNAVFTFCVAG